MIINEFALLNLQPELLQALAELGYTTPTPIQAALIPTMLTGQDVIGQAQTGTGKTAAFSLPILQSLAKNQRHVQCLVLAPTRELAMQVANAMYDYGRFMKVRVLAVYGGQPYARQIKRLENGVDVVIGTPGRLLDLIRRKTLDLSHVSTVVLDEADEMLSMGFIEDIEAILENTSATHQTALFSATLPQEIRKLAERYMNNPQSFIIERKQVTVSSIEQRYYLVNQSDKLAALTRLFEVEDISSALIFARTRVGTGDLANALTTRGFPAEALNGDMNQDARTRTLNRFREGQIKVLVATDVAARGLDIDDISHVFNYDLPDDVEVYVHRVGRTGRAGKTGIAISLLSPKEQWRLGKIERYIKHEISQAALPTKADIEQYRETQLVDKTMVWLRRGRCNKERAIVTQLVEEGHDPIEIAAAALKLARGEEKQRPIAPISKVTPEKGNRSRSRKGGRKGGRSSASPPKSYATEEGMIRLILDAGKLNGLRVNHVVGGIARIGDIPGHTIGKIHIQERETYVDVPEKFVDQVLAKKGGHYIGKQRVTIKRASQGKPHSHARHR